MIYHKAGHGVARGHNLYDGPVLRFLPFTYPPFAGALFSLMSRWPVVTAAALWQMFSFLALVGVVFAVLVERKVKLNAPVVAIGLGLSLAALALDAVRGTFFFGQINLFLMLLVAVDLLPKWRPWAGVGVGLAAGIKLTPAFMGLNFLIERNWRAAVVSVLTFLGTVWIGFQFVPDAKRFWTESVFQSQRIGEESNPGAQSIKAVLFREFGGVSTFTWLLIVVVLVALCIAGLLRSMKLGNRSFAMALSGITAAIVSPFSWFHHWVWLVPLGVCIVCLVNEKCVQFRERKNLHGVRGWVVAQLGALLAIVSLGVLMIPYYSKELYGKIGWTHQSMSTNAWWRQSFMLGGLVLVIGYGLWSLGWFARDRRAARRSSAGAWGAAAGEKPAEDEGEKGAGKRVEAEPGRVGAESVGDVDGGVAGEAERETAGDAEQKSAGDADTEEPEASEAKTAGSAVAAKTRMKKQGSGRSEDG
ncbi:glycosyltransferase 87 family protein [Corynebacterium heidelbergense]|uniref:glycosyltransferase 87 family protein n=1 Tax=Corynebacterium heidelbergense TaxID=2055947 RepID=UPI0010576982|nr:glycosyltransferase 87 family protein [Corynebacterium heidelbergense]